MKKDTSTKQPSDRCLHIFGWPGFSYTLRLLALAFALPSLALLSSCGSKGGSGGSPASPAPSAAPAPAPASPSSPSPAVGKVHLPPLGFAALVDKASGYMGEVVTCAGSTSGDGDGKISYSYQWEAASAPNAAYAAVGGSSGASFTLSQAQAHQFLRCVITAKDDQGATKTSDPSAVVAVANTAPSAFFPTLSSLSALTGDTLSCAASTADLDGDKLIYSFLWMQSGSKDGTYTEVPSASSSNLTITGALVGKYLKCQASAFDGLSRSTPALSVAALVADSPPNAFVATVSTLKTHVGETVSCSGSTVDPDGDVPSYTFQWMLAPASSLVPVAISGATQSTLVVTSSMAHQYLRCDITATNSHQSSTTSVSPALTLVDNTAPNDFSSFVSKSSAIVTDTLTCSAQAVDVDQDTLSYTFQWLVSDSASGSFAPMQGEAYPTFLVTPAVARKFLACQVTAMDGMGGVKTAAISRPTQVKNSKPSPFTPSAANVHVLTWDSVTCSGTTVDLDQDQLSYSYRWFMANADVGPFVPLPDTSPLVIIDLTLAHKVLKCQITADDGFGGVTQSDYSNVAYADNTAPAPFSATVSKTTAVVGDALSCSGGTSDLDGDNLVYSFQWSVASGALSTFSPLPGATSSTLTVTADVSHQFLRCSISADDGHGGVTVAKLSDVVTIANTAPAAFTASLPQTPSLVGAIDFCSGSTTDNDRDNLSYSYAWFSSTSAGGPYTPMVGQGANSMPITAALSRKYLKCQISADDGHGALALSQMSAAHYIANTAPAPFSATVDQTSVAVGDTLSCSGGTSDADLDIPTYHFEWDSSDSPDGIFTPVPGLSNILAAVPSAPSSSISVDSSLAHRVLRCSVTADDGFGGVTLSSASQTVTVVNTPPAAFAALPSKLTAYMGDSVSCNGTTGDADNDSLVYSYAWFVWRDPADPTEQPQKINGATAQVFNVVPSVAHLYLQCQITANDAHNGLTASSISPIITIGNTPPSPFGSAVDVTLVTVGGSINCSGGTIDVDGDDVTVDSYNWYSSLDSVNYSLIGGASTSSFQVSQTFAHRFFKCEVVAGDGHGGHTTSAKSPAVTYVNNAPDDFIATISPASTRVGGVITCGGTTSDLDGDSPSYTNQWFIAAAAAGPFPPASAIAGQTGSSLTVTSAMAHQYISCLRTAVDGYGGSKPSSLPSNAAQILNSAPVWGSLPNKNVLEAQTLTFTVTAADADKDNLTYSCTACQGGTMTPQGVFSITPAYDTASTQNPTTSLPLGLNVTDSQGVTTAASMNITVTNVARPPVLTVTSCPSSVNETDGWSVSYSVFDADGDPVTVSESSSPGHPGHTSAGSGSFTWGGSYSYATPSNPSPTYTTTLTATADSGKTAQATCSTTVNQVNAPPNVGNVTIIGTHSNRPDGDVQCCFGNQHYQLMDTQYVGSATASVSASQPGTSATVTSISFLSQNANIQYSGGPITDPPDGSSCAMGAVLVPAASIIMSAIFINTNIFYTPSNTWDEVNTYYCGGKYQACTAEGCNSADFYFSNSDH